MKRSVHLTPDAEQALALLLGIAPGATVSGVIQAALLKAAEDSGYVLIPARYVAASSVKP